MFFHLFLVTTIMMQLHALVLMRLSGRENECVCTLCHWYSGVARNYVYGGADPSARDARVETSKAPSGVGSGDGLQTHFLHILGHRTLLVERRKSFSVNFISMNYWSNNNFCRCPVLRGELAPAVPWLRHWTDITMVREFLQCFPVCANV